MVYDIKLDKNKSLAAPRGVSFAIDHIITFALLISLNIISFNWYFALLYVSLSSQDIVQYKGNSDHTNIPSFSASLIIYSLCG